MTSMPFSFGNAVSHYSKTGGPGGFLWRFALTYALIGCVLQAVSVWLQWPLYEIYIRMFTEGGGDIDPYIDDINRASATTTLGALLVMPFGLLLWLMFEAASQRYFGIPAARLDPAQAALLAAVLPNPVRYRVDAPSKYVRGRQAWILGQMRQLGPDYLSTL